MVFAGNMIDSYSDYVHAQKIQGVHWTDILSEADYIKAQTMPEPVDEVLNANDQISIVFDEPVDCSILSSDLNVKLYNIGNGEFIDVNISCTEATIAVEPDIPNSWIENHMLEVKLINIKDLAGNIVIANPNADPDDQYSAKWEFFVNRNPVAWSQPQFETISYIGEGATFTTLLAIASATAAAFALAVVKYKLVPSDKLAVLIPPITLITLASV